MAYEKQEWVARETVVSAERMTHIEDGIEATQAAADAAQAAADAAQAAADAAQAALDGLPQVQAGRVSITPSADSPTSADVEFPVPFSSPPEMTASAMSGVPGTVQEVTVDAITATGARIWLRRTNAVTTSISWIAVGPR